MYAGTSVLKDLGVAFEDEHEQVRAMSLFQDGYWFLMPFAFDSSNIFAARLQPENSIKDSDVVYRKSDDAITLAPYLKSFPVFINLKYCKSIGIVTKMIENELKDVLKISEPFLSYFQEVSMMDFHANYICNTDNLLVLKNPAENFDRVFLDHWNHYYPIEGQKLYAELMITLLDKKRFLPKYEKRDFGVWNNRMNYALSNRAYMRRDLSFEEKEKFFWDALSQTHGFDALDVSFELIPNLSSDSGMTIRMVIDEFDTSDTEVKFSDEILKSPLFHAVQKLRADGVSYDGMAHFEAAKIFDVEHNNPSKAWEALVSASYWAGKKHSKAIEPMWEAAIYLSEKSGWKEINEVLIQQFEFYQKHKSLI